MLSGPSLSTLPLPSLLQYLLLVSYRAEDKVGHIFNEHKFYLLKDEMIVKMDHQKLKESLCPQLLVLGNFVSQEDLEGAATTLDQEFHRLTETEVRIFEKIIYQMNIFYESCSGGSGLFCATPS